MYPVVIEGPNPRTEILITTMIHRELEDAYNLHGGKTGAHLKGVPEIDGTHLVVIAETADGVRLVGAVRGARTLEGRFLEMKKALDNAVLLLRNPHAPVAEIAADSVAVAELPASSPLSQDYDPPLLFAQNPDCAGHMASITKLMTAMVMLDHISDLDELVEVQESNLRRGTGNFLQVGDVASYRDLLHAMLLPSSNTAAHVIARCVGKKVLLEDQRLA